jgi:hypothetical protein
MILLTNFDQIPFERIRMMFQNSSLFLTNVYCVNENVRFTADRSVKLNITDVRHLYIRAKWIALCRKLLLTSSYFASPFVTELTETK